jgi:hypothetical protein
MLPQGSDFLCRHTGAGSVQPQQSIHTFTESLILAQDERWRRA